MTILRFSSMATAVVLAGSIVMAGINQTRASDEELSVIGEVYDDPSTSKPRFSEQFLKAVSFGQIEAAVAGLRDRFGSALAVRQKGESYEIETATHLIPVLITLNDDNRIEGLLFKPAQKLTASISETLELLEGIPGSVSYAVTRNGDIVHERDADLKLAVGSAFKLAVMKVLGGDIDAGRHDWDETLRLEDNDRSLPSGRLQDYPTDSPFTLHTLAAGMIAESDNTATDMLIRLLGRDRIAEALGTETLLTTRELFTLKADPGLLERYGEAGPDDRRAIIASIAGRALPSPAQVLGPYREGAEWHVSNRTLCELAAAVRHIDVFAINPGPVEAANWESVAYKGGSETGVINLTAALEATDGARYCVSVTVNDDGPVSNEDVAGLFSRLTAQLADRSGDAD